MHFRKGGTGPPNPTPGCAGDICIFVQQRYLHLFSRSEALRESPLDVHYFLFYKILTALNEVSVYFIDGRRLHVERKFKHRTYAPYPYHYKKRVTYLVKIEAHRTAIVVDNITQLARRKGTMTKSRKKNR